MDLLDLIIAEWETRKHERQINWELFEVLNNVLLDKVRKSLQFEMISKKGYQQMVQRIPSYNIHKRLVDKTAKVYVEPAVRYADKESDQKLLNDIVKAANLDRKMNLANRYLNSMRSFALEPVLCSNGRVEIRVLAPWCYMPYSDSKSEPNKMTAFVKLIGQSDKGYDIIKISTQDSVIVTDTQRGHYPDIQNQLSMDDMSNPFGFIPVVYRNNNTEMLHSFVNEEGLDMAILLPKLFGDINYASKYLCHSIIWSRNVNLENAEINPDAIWDLGDTSEEGKQIPEVGSITPTIDIPNLLLSISTQIQSYFESEGVKATVTQGDASGISKALDDGDITDLRKEQISLFRDAESELFGKIKVMQDIWSNTQDSVEKRTFSESFPDDFVVAYPEMKAMKSTRQKLEEAKLWREEKLMSRRQAIKELKPELSEANLIVWIDELDTEAEESAKRLSLGLPSLLPEKKSDGTFQDQNQQGSKQTPEGGLAARKGK